MVSRLRPRLAWAVDALALLSLLFVTVKPAAAAEPAEATSIAANANSTRPPRDIADLKALEQRIRKTVAEVSPSVVSVAGASGVVISDDGYVLTVAHVGQRAGRSVIVTFPDGRRAQAVTLGNDYGTDAGMVKISSPGPWPHAKTTSSRDLKPGQWCLTLGYPMTFEHGKPPVVRIGRILRNEKGAVITDCTIMGGDSGAPLFDLDGKVLAIGTKCDNSLVYNIHVPLDRFTAVWDRLVQGEDFDSLAPKPALGVTAAEGADDARLGNVNTGSAAEQAGLKRGDVLLKFDGNEVRKFEELPPLVQRHKPGDKVEIEFRRGGENLKRQVVLGRSDAGESQ